MTNQLDVKFRTATKWRDEGDLLRSVLLGCGLVEELKWGKPCYTFEGKNVVLIQRQKDFLALLFFDGALLKDPKGVLHWTGKNSRVGKRMLFTSVSEVTRSEATLKAYIREAIQIQAAGLKVAAPTELTLPAELSAKFKQLPKLRAAFDKLTPGRQRHYCMYFAEPKQAKTRVSRIEQHAPRILAGKGLRDVD